MVSIHIVFRTTLVGLVLAVVYNFRVITGQLICKTEKYSTVTDDLKAVTLTLEHKINTTVEVPSAHSTKETPPSTDACRDVFRTRVRILSDATDMII